MKDKLNQVKEKIKASCLAAENRCGQIISWIDRRRPSYLLMIGIFGAIGFSLDAIVNWRSLTEPGISVDIPELDSLPETLDRGLAVQEDILAALTPRDGIEVLASRGYQFTRNQFWQAARNGDARSVLLFCSAAPNGWLYASDIPRSLPESMFETIETCIQSTQVFRCDVLEPDTMEHLLRHAISVEERSGLVSQICGAGFTRLAERTIAHNEEQSRLRILERCRENWEEIELMASRVNSESWSQTSAAINRITFRIQSWESTPLNMAGTRTLAAECRDVHDIDFYDVTNELRQEWENGGKSLP